MGPRLILPTLYVELNLTASTKEKLFFVPVKIRYLVNILNIVSF